MKAILFGFSLFCLFFPVLAQESPTRSVEESSQKVVLRWHQDVSLNNEQKEKIYTLSVNFIHMCDSLDSLNSIPFESRMDEKEVLHASYLSSIERLLNANQKDRYEKLCKEREAFYLLEEKKLKQK